MLFQAPPLDERELDVCARLETLRAALRSQVAHERRWSGMLRRVAAARAIQGSNSIEGLNVTLDDAVAAVAGVDPMDTPPRVWRAIQGYRDALTFILQLADDPNFRYDASLLKSLHFMMTKDDLRSGPVVGGPDPCTCETSGRRRSCTRRLRRWKFPIWWPNSLRNFASRMKAHLQWCTRQWHISTWS